MTTANANGNNKQVAGFTLTCNACGSKDCTINLSVNDGYMGAWYNLDLYCNECKVEENCFNDVT